MEELEIEVVAVQKQVVKELELEVEEEGGGGSGTVEVLSCAAGERSHSAARGPSRQRGSFLVFFFFAL